MYMCLLFSLTVHEAAHAAMAYRCGDDTAKHLGRLTLNPIAHIDPLGTVIMPLLMFTTGFPFLFGWAKPVPFNPGRLSDVRRDPVLIAAAGPASNLVIALVVAVIGKAVFSIAGAELPVLFAVFLLYMVIINLVLLFFNFIPVPPLDGHYVLNYFLPPEGQRILQGIGPFGILIAILAARPLFRALDPVFAAFESFMLGGMG